VTKRITVNPASLLSANAVRNGNGGQVVVWAEGETIFAGQISARGGAAGGDGGSAEVSGQAGLAWQGQVDLAAPGGQAGSLLLDPKNIHVAGLAFDEFVDPNPAAGNWFGDSVVPLSTGNVVITSPGDGVPVQRFDRRAHQYTARLQRCRSRQLRRGGLDQWQLRGPQFRRGNVG
jgi:hypothetical protein